MKFKRVYSTFEVTVVEIWFSTFSNNLSSLKAWNWKLWEERTKKQKVAYLGIKLVKDVFEVVAFYRLFRVKKLEELLNELWRDVLLKSAHFYWLVNNKLQEKLVNALQVRPCGVHLLLLVDTSLSDGQVAFLDVGQRTENVSLDHCHDLLEVWNNEHGNWFLVKEQLLELLNGV